MARLLYTAAVAEIRGKMNGTVFSRNKGGAYIRNKVTPTNPKTPYQTQQRSFVSDISKAWSGILTDEQRLAWTAYGLVVGAKSVFGNALTLSGIATYVKVNQIIQTAGGTRIDDPPVNQQVGSILSLTLTATHTMPAITATFTPSPLVTPEGLYIFATPQISPGISNATTRLRFIGYFAAATSPLEISTEWVKRFGSLPSAAGQRIAITAQVVNLDTGAISTPASASALVS